MTFSKSNLNVLSDSLFTELTADQAQMLEGGKRIDILLVRCIKPGDPDGTDELFFNIDGTNFLLGNPIDMKKGGVANAGVGANFNITTHVKLLDKNGSGANGAIFLGSFGLVNQGNRVLNVIGPNGTKYEVTTRVTN